MGREETQDGREPLIQGVLVFFCEDPPAGCEIVMEAYREAMRSEAKHQVSLEARIRVHVILYLYERRSSAVGHQERRVCHAICRQPDRLHPSNIRTDG